LHDKSTADEPGAAVAQLVRHAAKGDQRAYSQLVERYKDSLYRLALRILRRPADAEDAVQEAFIKAYVHLDSYQDTYSFYTWIAAILTNVCYSALRARDWHVGSMPDQLLLGLRSVDSLEAPEMAALVRSRDELLSRAIRALPEKYARILVLRYWSDLSYQEVADATSQSLGAVKTQLRRATILLRESLAPRRLDLAPEPA
jgi:RNA polymerase sigma-70 factor, ECF subfamily